MDTHPKNAFELCRQVKFGKRFGVGNLEQEFRVGPYCHISTVENRRYSGNSCLQPELNDAKHTGIYTVQAENSITEYDTACLETSGHPAEAA